MSISLFKHSGQEKSSEIIKSNIVLGTILSTLKTVISVSYLDLPKRQIILEVLVTSTQLSLHVRFLMCALNKLAVKNSGTGGTREKTSEIGVTLLKSELLRVLFLQVANHLSSMREILRYLW